MPQSPGHGFLEDSAGVGPAPLGHGPCALPNAWPPPMSATVSVSFIPMRENVVRMSILPGRRGVARRGVAWRGVA